MVKNSTHLRKSKIYDDLENDRFVMRGVNIKVKKVSGSDKGIQFIPISETMKVRNKPIQRDGNVIITQKR